METKALKSITGKTLMAIWDYCSMVECEHRKDVVRERVRMARQNLAKIEDRIIPTIAEIHMLLKELGEIGYKPEELENTDRDYAAFQDLKKEFPELSDGYLLCGPDALARKCQYHVPVHRYRRYTELFEKVEKFHARRAVCREWDNDVRRRYARIQRLSQSVRQMQQDRQYWRSLLNTPLEEIMASIKPYSIGAAPSTLLSLFAINEHNIPRSLLNNFFHEVGRHLGMIGDLPDDYDPRRPGEFGEVVMFLLDGKFPIVWILPPY